MLPYNTLQEAEAALGRNLTLPETLWFNYSSNMSDYLLYWHSFLFLLLVFSIAPLPMALVDLKRLPRFDKYKIQPKVRFSSTDMFRCYKDAVLMLFLVAGPMQFLSCPLIKMSGIRTGLPLPSGWEILLQLVVCLMIEDYATYWLHRLLHGKWGYEKIHRVHHEYTAPIGFAASYAHWADFLILGIPTFLGPAIVPGHIVTYWLWIVLKQIETIDTHSGYDLPWSITKYIPFYGGAQYHDYHHYVGQQCQSNFASVFTYCDYIYGTDKGFRYQKKIRQKLNEALANGGGRNGGSYSSVLNQDFKSE